MGPGRPRCRPVWKDRAMDPHPPGQKGAWHHRLVPSRVGRLSFALALAAPPAAAAVLVPLRATSPTPRSHS